MVSMGTKTLNENSSDGSSTLPYSTNKIIIHPTTYLQMSDETFKEFVEALKMATQPKPFTEPEENSLSCSSMGKKRGFQPRKTSSSLVQDTRYIKSIRPNPRACGQMI